MLLEIKPEHEGELGHGEEKGRVGQRPGESEGDKIKSFSFLSKLFQRNYQIDFQFFSFNKKHSSENFKCSSMYA
jgi:hypothetical protein